MNLQIQWILRFCLLLGYCSLSATNYYFHPVIGNDSFSGQTKMDPFQTLDAIQQLQLLPGDVLLLAAGYEFAGTIHLEDQSGIANQPITIKSLDWENRPGELKAIIDAKGFSSGIRLINCSHIFIENVSIKANGSSIIPTGQMRCGILVESTRSGRFENIQIHKTIIKEIFFENPGYIRDANEVRTPNGTKAYGWGIRFINNHPNSLLKDIVVSNCQIANVGHTGIKFTSRGGQRIQNFKVHHNQVEHTGGPGIQMSGVRHGHIHHNLVNHSGSPDDTRKWGRGSGLWTWGSTDVVIEHNRFMNANGPADSAGCHIDFNCRNVIVQYNLSANNAGGFCEILGNNYNCAYRYNISVNDGHRVKGENNAFQDGKTFWLSGYVGRKKKRNGPFQTYFYNNTIYVADSIIAKMAVDRASKGVLVMNNLFYIAGDSKHVLGDQYKPADEGPSEITDVLFQNNLFLKSTNWPAATMIQPENQQIGDPGFLNPGGWAITDYIPRNQNLIKDQGEAIPFIPNDTIGLTIGLEAKFDILGNPIKGQPDMGAIELY